MKASKILNDQRQVGSEYCDVKFELENEDKPVFGHLCVIAAQSKAFSFLPRTFQNRLKITIKNFSCQQCLQTMVDFFYEDVISVAKEHETHFKILAQLLEITEILKIYQVDRHQSNNIAYMDNKECNSQVPSYEAKLEHSDIFDEEHKFFKISNPRNGQVNNKIIYCIGCEFKTYRVQEMIEHMNNCDFSKLTCSLCELGFLSWREYDTHLKKHSSDLKKPFFCLDCDTRFITRAALLLHLPKHTTEAPHLCPLCGKSFKWKNGLSSHIKIHNNEKQMLCDVCGYSTKHMKALKSHKLQHNGELYRCTYPGCKHSANRKENLKLHIETHNNKQSYVCEVCGCKFSQSKNLKRHALKHEPGSEKKFNCQLCSFHSHRSDKLKEHEQRVHREKEMQLELPEIVDNAFESKMGDEFALPIIPNSLLSSKENRGDEKKAKVKVRKIEIKTREKCRTKRLRLLAPKTVNMDDSVVKEATPTLAN